MKDIKEKISVIMPAYNEAGRIASSVDETIRTFRYFGCSFELIVMDDGEVWTGWHDGDHGWLYVSGNPVNCAVTHWMDFPAPPEAA